MTEVAVIIGSGSIGVAIGRGAGIGRKAAARRLQRGNHEHRRRTAPRRRLRRHHPPDRHLQPRLRHRPGRRRRGWETSPASSSPPGVSPVQATTERVLHVDLVGTAYVLEEFGRVIASGGSGVVIASMAGHMGDGLPEGHRTRAGLHPHRRTARPAVPRARHGRQFRRRLHARQTRQRAARPGRAAITWGARGARINCLSPGIISTPLAQDEMSGPFAEGYPHDRHVRRRPDGHPSRGRRHRRASSSAPKAPSSPAPTCSSTAASSPPCGPVSSADTASKEGTP